ncbi:MULTISPECIES: GxxExxY protein [unclassified Lentimicrobium]|uniref:GxxExxY protein n=1 Tax=unclassified Lentimicrobium TaxID=2677434 RepID=UPI00155655D9|nr:MULTISPECIES: GxxExxY protein [unclassified Lentimicrobium]NPD44206.1 GxxExxY protein [Lentimicrobium sp. S6]NPD84664.1 GxxExxY protein [Lentimicrobium sp. L6]
MHQLILPEESYLISGAFFAVYNELGPGFLESVYQEALALEFTELNIPFKEQLGMNIIYKNKILNKKFYADFLCFEDIIIEIKAVEKTSKEHESQILNYLKATNKPLGLLVNFGSPKISIKRFANTLRM